MALDLNAVVTGHGPPLVVLHGLFGSATNWRGIARALADRFEVHALDLRNHGESPWADEMDYPVMADDVHGYIAGARTGAAGRCSATAWAARSRWRSHSPHRMRSAGLIVADIAPIGYADTLGAYVEVMRAIDPARAGSRSEVQRVLQDRLPDPSVAGFLAQNLVSRPEGLAWRINLEAIAAAMPVLRSFPDALRARRCGAPLTVIAGADSAYVTHADGREFAPMFDDVRIEVIAGAGHWVHADRPQEFVAIVRRTLGADA